MILIGDENIAYENIERINSVTDISKTSPNSTILYEFCFKTLEYSKENQLNSAVIVKDLKEVIYASSFSVKYIIVENNIAKHAQDIVNNYMLDSKILVVIDSDDEIEDDSNTLKMSILMTPEKANFSGNIHGGAILKHLDEIAYACASRYCGHYVVTLSVDKVLFKDPIHVGELVTFLASVNFTGETSMEIGIKVTAEDVIKRTVKHTNTCYFTMVALDKEGKPTPVPPLNPTNPINIKRYEKAKLRRELRMENKL